ncbi:ABC-three component system protein [Pseudomonas otitidis]|uniref:ABC-three component system protein n=2 Tax=Metapseudomonas otitidis TaxID=319939 RepID=A0ABU3XV57_9GAMM|nr:ABC-three component system protein [Pseudomonas otitidis]MDV3441813.1 ABC-three component system protein [Pseudomonas otitidis]
MDGADSNAVHDASAAALGFYYQSQYALLTLVQLRADDAAVAIERLDDVEIKANGQTLLQQLKHSIQENPPPVTLTCVALWKTIKVWIDAIPQVSLADTRFHLVTVGSVPDESPLMALCAEETDREPLLKAMLEEAQRVVAERADDRANNVSLRHAARAKGCEAFLTLEPATRFSLLKRIFIKSDEVTVSEIPAVLSRHLHLLPKEHRLRAAESLLAWWDLQVVYTLCGKRERVIYRSEVEHTLSSIISQLDEDKLTADFDMVNHPDDYEADSMLYRQIALVGGKPSDISKAVREQWRAVNQRAKWILEKPQLRSKIALYDTKLQESWSDIHARMVEDCEALSPEEVASLGLNVLRWTHDVAPKEVEPISSSWSGHYYVRGTYQLLAIDLKVGWHAHYLKLLKE